MVPWKIFVVLLDGGFGGGEVGLGLGLVGILTPGRKFLASVAFG